MNQKQKAIQAYALHRRATIRLTKAWRGIMELMQDEFPMGVAEKAFRRRQGDLLFPSIMRITENACNRFAEFMRDEYHRSMIIERVNAEDILQQVKVKKADNFGRVDFSGFGMTNPASVHAHAQNRMHLIREVSDEQRKNFRNILTEEAVVGTNPRQSAIRVRESLGLTQNQEKYIRNYEQELRSGNFSKVRTRRLRDHRFDRALETAQKTGTKLSEEKIQKMVKRYRERWVKHRAETIARTESLRAVRQGQDGMWQTLLDEGSISEDRIRRFWVATQDGRTRDSHAVMPTINSDGVKVGEPFLSGKGNQLMYPGDPSAPPSDTVDCRCVISYLPAGQKPNMDGVILDDSELPPSQAGIPLKAKREISGVLNRNIRRKMPDIGGYTRGAGISPQRALGGVSGGIGEREGFLRRLGRSVLDRHRSDFLEDVLLEPPFLIMDSNARQLEQMKEDLKRVDLRLLEDLAGLSTMTGIPIDELQAGVYDSLGRFGRS